VASTIFLPEAAARGVAAHSVHSCDQSVIKQNVKDKWQQKVHLPDI
jgi:hypothetical protein